MLVLSLEPALLELLPWLRNVSTLALTPSLVGLALAPALALTPAFGVGLALGLERALPVLTRLELLINGTRKPVLWLWALV